MCPARQIKLANVKLCVSLMRLCENEVDNIVCFLPALATPFLHDFSFRLGFVILSKRSVCRCEGKIKVNLARDRHLCVFENGNKT